MIWIEKGVPKEIYDKAYQQQMLEPTERYGKVRIKAAPEPQLMKRGRPHGDAPLYLFNDS